ncbi:MAG TPA: hypothetical protein VNJ51_06180 [Candidatus Dormibacteraeota bacterium]|nr:hypothetical protein [Candidatus Dormibacteraeota bacterium]
MEGFGTLQFWAKLIDFVLFVAFLMWLWIKYGRPQVEAAVDAENGRIAGAEQALAKARSDADAAREARRVADAEREAILHNADETGAHAVVEHVAEAKAQAERIRAHAEGEVDRQRYAARVRLRIEMIEDALIKARRDAAARTDESLQSSLVEGFLDDLARERKAVN